MNAFGQSQIKPFSPGGPRVLILGTGRFGQLAIRRLGQRWPLSAVTVVDRAIHAGQVPDGAGVAVVTADAIEYLARFEDLADAWDWIVPAVPVHLAGEWIRKRLSKTGRIEMQPVPEAVAVQVPNPMRGAQGQLYASNADFICPDDCPEPATICTMTGRPRPQVLYDHLAALSVPGFRVVVVRSRQLAPGVGGYSPADLDRAFAQVRLAPGPVLLATACKCHGVIEAFRHSDGRR